MADNAIEIDKLFVKIDDHVVLKNLSVTVERGECLAILGPSGSGKTTLLKTIAGLLRQESGTLKFFGDEMGRALPELRPVSMQFQKPAMFDEQTVEANALYGMLRSMPRDEALFKIAELADAFKLHRDCLKRKYEDLSGGEQQKAAFIRTFINAKKIVLLDEPIRAAFDLHQRRELMQTMNEIAMQKGLTMIVVTHEFVEAAFFSKRVMVLLQGESWIGKLNEMYHSPERQQLARVLGFGNEIDAGVLLDNDARQKICPLYIKGSLPNYNDATVAFIRPHNMQVNKDGKGFFVERISFSGSYNRVILCSKQGNNAIEAEVEQRFTITLGQEVGVEVNAGDIIFFDRCGELAGD